MEIIKRAARKMTAKTAAPANIKELHEERSHSEIMVIVGALMLTMLLGALDQTIVSTALPHIASELNGLNKIAWVATAYLLTSAIVTPIYGKISDSIGRKKVFIFAISTFLIGSVLAGIAQTMDQLVIFRAIQGIGGGGIMSLSLAVIGDIVPARQRGRYQGYFGAVFGLSSIAGPLLGGLFTEHLSWRWIFYINVPLGLLAMAAISLRLHLPKTQKHHSFDFAGSALMAGSVASLLLALTWGGINYPWGSSTIISLFASAVALAIGFIFWERRAAEPIFPGRLFKGDIFRVSSILSLLSGVIMMGSIIFIPMYQQIVRGESPTMSGLLMLPLVAGLFTGSVGSGKLISKTGRYKMFPIIGNAALVLGLYLFTHIGLHTNQGVLAIWMYILGLGVGLSMQVMTLAVQNSSERRDLGTATSIIVFFRSLGGSLGVAIFGAILTNRVTHHLLQGLPSGSSIDNSHLAGSIQSSTSAMQALPAQVQHVVLSSYTSAFADVFMVAVPFAVIALAVAFLLRESPLKEGTKEEVEADFAGM